MPAPIERDDFKLHCEALVMAFSDVFLAIAALAVFLIMLTPLGRPPFMPAGREAAIDDQRAA